MQIILFHSGETCKLMLHHRFVLFVVFFCGGLLCKETLNTQEKLVGKIDLLTTCTAPLNSSGL